MKRGVLLLAPLWLLIAAAPSGAESPPLTVFVSVLPQKFFAERIAGERADVHVMVGPGKSPATYEPTPRQMARLGDAALYFSSGVPFERVWLPKIAAASRKMRIVATARDVGRRGKAEGGEGDPHVWTSPLAAIEMARIMATALSEADPDHSGAYRAGLADLTAELAALDEEIRRVVDPLPRRTFFVFHPSWGHFAVTYRLEQVAIEQGGGEPGARHLAGLIERARREKAGVIFAQPQFDRRNAEAVARAVGGRVVIIDPLAEDYAANLKAVAAALAEALR